MQVQRQFIDITSTKVLLELPESFVNHRVELIVLTVDEGRAPGQETTSASSRICR